MQAKELRTKTETELMKMIADQRKSVEKVMEDVYKGKEKNLSKARSLRKEIAVIKTVLNEKKIMKEIENA